MRWLAIAIIALIIPFASAFDLGSLFADWTLRYIAFDEEGRFYDEKMCPTLDDEDKILMSASGLAYNDLSRTHKYTIKSPSGEETSKIVRTNFFKLSSSFFEIPPEAEPGIWTITLEGLESGEILDSLTFEVSETENGVNDDYAICPV